MPSPETSRQRLLQVYQAALEAVNGRVRARDFLEQYPLDGPVYLIAVGKAVVSMTEGAIEKLQNQIQNAFLVTKHGYAGRLPWPVRTAGHPLPDAASLAAGEQLLAFIEGMPTNARVLVLLSGGASSLVEVLPAGNTLEQLQRLNRWLLASGLDIAACNGIRQGLSCIKGGRLAVLLAPHPTLCLTISDVPGDDPAVIASGPLVAKEDKEPAEMPDWVMELAHAAPTTPGPNAPCFQYVRTAIVATLAEAKRAAACETRSLGYTSVVQEEFLSGDAIAAGRRLGRAIGNAKPNAVLIWGGETTVRLPANPGRGGRSQSLALAAAIELEGKADHFLLAAGTDGTDGPGTDAGALIDGWTISRGREYGLDAEQALLAADAGTFLKASGDLIATGPTGTNVMDLAIGVRM